MFGSYWGLISGSLILVLGLIYKRVEDTSKKHGVAVVEANNAAKGSRLGQEK
jgi:hypothetical protein